MSTLNASAPAFVPSTEEMDLVGTPIANPDWDALEYPFSFIKDSEVAGWCADYEVNEFAEGLIGEEKCEPGNFPNNIAEFYWIFEGHNDEEAWKVLCRLDNGNYALYLAWCDYTGFDCQGGMKLIVSKDMERLFYEGMTEQQRYQCLKDKRNPAEPVEKTYISKLSRARDAPPFKADPDAPKTSINNLPKARKPKPFKWNVPVVPVAKPAAEATRAFIRVWENGKELILNLDHVNGMEMEALEYAIAGLTARFLTPKGAPKPKKKFYTINICAGTCVYYVDDYFKKRFGDPEKKWELQMKFSGSGIIRKWGKVEVSFILF
jgi:hypothetical protein